MPAALKTFVAAVIQWALSLRIVRTMLLYGERRGPVLADSVTYRALFSIFAAVSSGSVGRWLADNPEAWDALVEAVDTVIPGLIGEGGVISLDTLESGLTIAGVVGFVGLVLASLGAVGTLRAALHVLGGTVFDDGFFLWVQLKNLAMAVGAWACAGRDRGCDLLLDGGGVGRCRVARILHGDGAGRCADAGRCHRDGLHPGCRTDRRDLPRARRHPASARALGRIPPRGSGATVLQQLSGLFVQGASSNPLLSASVTLIALLLC